MLDHVYDITLVPRSDQVNLVKIVLQFRGMNREAAIAAAKGMYPDYEVLRVFPWNPHLMKEEKG